MNLIAVRGAQGVVTWRNEMVTLHTHQWVCNRDGFIVAGPDDPTQADNVALAIATHSAGVVGAITQIVQLDL